MKKRKDETGSIIGTTAPTNQPKFFTVLKLVGPQAAVAKKTKKLNKFINK